MFVSVNQPRSAMDSMTGFGRGTARRGRMEATVEMRSVNGRYAEVNARLPRELSEHEQALQNRVKDAFARGRISVSVQLEEEAGEGLGLEVDAAAARAYAGLLERLRDAAGIDAPVTLDHLLAYDAVFRSREADPEEAEEAWAAVQAAAEEAIAGLAAMRRQEGRALADDLAARVAAIEALLEDVEARAPGRIREARQKLRDRLEELLADERVDADRIEVEMTILADKLDVTEECVRLRSHLQVFREALDQDEPAGRKLNFIAQEINREVNTIGSKANDAEVAHLAVAMKEELEKIREQVQNVE